MAEIIERVRTEGLRGRAGLHPRFDGVELDETSIRVTPRRSRPAPPSVRARGARRHRLRRRAHPRLSRAPAAGRRALHRRGRRRARLALDAAGGGGRLCARRPGGLSLDRADERRAGQGRRASSASPWSRRRAGWSRRCWRRRRRPASPRSGASAAPRPARRWPMAPGRSGRWTRSSGPATPMSPPPSAGSTASSASTPWPARRRSWWWPTRPNDPDWIAADLLSQAEHDPDAQSILITDDAAFADAVERGGRAPADHAGDRRGRRAVLARPRRGDHRAAGRRAGPGRPDRARARRVRGRRAGARWPTGCATPARSSSAATRPRRSATMWPAPTTCCRPAARRGSRPGLSIYDFLKRTSIIACDAAAFARLAPADRALAEAEGLPAHARSVSIRRNRQT